MCGVPVLQCLVSCCSVLHFPILVLCVCMCGERVLRGAAAPPHPTPGTSLIFAYVCMWGVRVYTWGLVASVTVRLKKKGTDSWRLFHKSNDLLASAPMCVCVFECLFVCCHTYRHSNTHTHDLCDKM